MGKSLDDGVMSKPTTPFTKNRTSKSLDFEAMIGSGENPNGQTTIAPAEVSRGGQPGGNGYSSWNYGGNTDGERWNSNPMLNKERHFESNIAVAWSKPRKKKK